MAETFTVGEIAEVAASISHPEYVGRDCEILGPYQHYVCKNGTAAYGYWVRIDGEPKTWVAAPDRLRKKRPPRDDMKVIRWDECPWQPEKVTL
jgi:hypothetical protein